MHRQGYGHRSPPGAGGHSEWRHDPSHRRNVAYRGTNVRERYGQAARPMADGRKDLSGRLPDARTTGTRTGERSNMEQRRETPGRDRAALDRHMTAPTNNRAVTEQRMIPPVSGRTSTDKRQDNPVVVERLGTHQRKRCNEACNTTFKNNHGISVWENNAAFIPSVKAQQTRLFVVLIR